MTTKAILFVIGLISAKAYGEDRRDLKIFSYDECVTRPQFCEDPAIRETGLYD